MSTATRHRWSVASRAIAGTLGAYCLTSIATVALSLVLVRTGMDRVEAVTAATLTSFALFASIAMAAFHARSATRTWAWLVGAGLPLALLSWVLTRGAAT